MSQAPPFSPDPLLLTQDWQDTFDALDDFVAIIDADFRLVKVNRAMAKLLGADPKTLVGAFCYRVMHNLDRHWESCPLEEMLHSNRPVTHEVDDPHIGLPLLVTVSPLYNGAGKRVGAIHIAKDISAIKTIENDLHRKNHQLDSLNRLLTEAIRCRQNEPLIELALREIKGICAVDQVLYYRREGAELVLGGALPAEGELNQRKRVGICLCGLAAANGAPVYSMDIAADIRCSLNECKAAGVRSFAALPLMHQQENLGILGLASRTERDFVGERDFLETLAGTLSLVLSNAQMIEELQRHAERLEERIRERTGELEGRNRELERFNKLFVDREFRIKELRDQVAELESALNRRDRS